MTFLKSLHWRWAFPSTVLLLAGFPLLALAFDNDHHMAEVFHPMAYWWAMVVHVLVLLLPVVAAFQTPERGLLTNRNILMGSWFTAILLAFVGNIAGGIAHASGRTISELLDHAPTDASALRMAVGGAGGFVIVALEFAIGRVAESNLGRLFFGHSPAERTALAAYADGHADALPDSRADKPRVSVRRSDGQTVLVSGGRRTALPDSGRTGADRRGQREMDSARTDAGRTDADKEPVVRVHGQRVRGLFGGDGQRRGQQPAPVRGRTDTDTKPVRGRTDTVLPPADGLTPEHLAAVDAYAVAGNVRDAATLLKGRGIRMGKSKLSALVQEAREINPTWVAALLGDE